jgi:hypothetical protein
MVGLICSFCRFHCCWIRIQIRIPNTDTDPGSRRAQINAGPNPSYTYPVLKYCFKDLAPFSLFQGKIFLKIRRILVQLSHTANGLLIEINISFRLPVIFSGTSWLGRKCRPTDRHSLNCFYFVSLLVFLSF